MLNYLNFKKKNKIIELGGGYGKLAYYLLKNISNYTYIDLDIPETLTLASFFLSKSFPNKKNLFYGESNFNNNTLNEFDLIINHIKKFYLPHDIRKYFSLKDVKRIISFMINDKKNNANKINLILLKKIGTPLINKQFSKEKLKIFLNNELSD